MHKILEKLKEEFFAILPPTIFFFVALHLLTFIRLLMTKGSHFEPLSTMSIAIASLILGKAVLIADMLPPINRYPNKPLAYNIAWKTLIYLLMASVIHDLERLIDFARQAGGIVAGNEKLLAEIVWRISGRYRSSCSCSSWCIAPRANWRALSGGKRCCGYSLGQLRYRPSERELRLCSVLDFHSGLCVVLPP
jgi:hypothetical protein